ncbi:hypothetical protein H4Q26_004452 [Puccinia striiformis f. sp. tritici PST-130]|nr:hypothetical protein H4Q26_004452 [Puccinia striiformis f. sp. tritici PST-130]
MAGFKPAIDNNIHSQWPVETSHRHKCMVNVHASGELVRALEERVRVNGEHASQRYNDLKAALEGAKENAAAEISRLNRMLITEQCRNYNLQEALSRARATAALAVEKANRACRGLREKEQQVEELWARLAAQYN